MPLQNLQLMSVRIDPDTIKKLDDFCSRHRYWKRNTVINAILYAVMNNFTERDIYDMARTNPLKKETITAKYEIIMTRIPPRH